MASRGVNKVIILGRLGQDPEVRYAPSGAVFANMTVATSEQWRDKQTGEQKEQTEWHRVVVSGKLAEIAGEYLRKGSEVYLEGKLRTRKWTDQSGVEKYTTEVLVGVGGSMQMLGSKQEGNRQSAPQQQGSQQQSTSSTNNAPPMDFDDDVPFAPVTLSFPRHTIHAI